MGEDLYSHSFARREEVVIGRHLPAAFWGKIVIRKGVSSWGIPVREVNTPLYGRRIRTDVEMGTLVVVFFTYNLYSVSDDGSIILALYGILGCKFVIPAKRIDQPCRIN